MQNSKEYQQFLTDDYKVEEEAPQFLQQGYFFGPLGNTMVIAVSNALGLPVVVFSSASYSPVINITPRACVAAIPLYVAFNHVGAGHYDAVSFNREIDSAGNISVGPQDTPCVSRCTCGKNNKHSQVKRCVSLKLKYTTTIPAYQPVIHALNFVLATIVPIQKGLIKPSNSSCSGKLRQWHKHAWNSKFSKSVEFAYKQQEKTKEGPHTLLEYLLISEILKYCWNNVMNVTVDLVHMLYNSSVELVQVLEVHLSLGLKNSEAISKILGEYEVNLKNFRTMCVTQLRLNN